jgi:hypothetical protein
MRHIIQSIRRKIKRTLYPHTTITLYGLDRGFWYDTDTRMFHAMFELLAEYVENECAWMETISTETYSRWDRFKQYWFPRKWRMASSRALAMKHLTWASELIDEQGERSEQARHAQKVIRLYTWYMDEFPTMVDPYESIKDPEFLFVDAEGHPTNEMFYGRDNDGYIYMNKYHPEYLNVLDDIRCLEASQNEMIDANLRELLEIRRGLWT